MSNEQNTEELTGMARRMANIRPHCFKKGECGNPKGRPKGSSNRIPALIKEVMGAKKSEKVEGLNHMEIDSIELTILSMDLKGLQALAKADSTPAYMKTLAMAAIIDMKNGKTKVMDLLRDRQFGAVKKEVDVTTNGMSMTQPQSLTPSEAKEMLANIEKEF